MSNSDESKKHKNQLRIKKYDLNSSINEDGYCAPLHLVFNAIGNQTYENISFDNLRLSSCYLLKVKFINCRFSNVKWKKSDIKTTSFIDCKFEEGRFQEMAITNSTIENTSFSRMHHFETTVSKCSVVSTEFMENQCERIHFLYCDVQGLSAGNNSIVSPGVAKFCTNPDSSTIESLQDMGVVIDINDSKKS